MNPVLLKPTSDVGCQVIVMGRAAGTWDALSYGTMTPRLRGVIRAALETVREHADVVVIEGAGSPAEVNLKDRDLANMWVAREADAPVVLVGDIDRGGVFAQFVGTLELLDAEERQRVRGFLVNKFRGDASLLQPGLDWLEARCGRPVLGTIPYLPSHGIAAEDAVAVERAAAGRRSHDAARPIRIDVVHLPRISNFTDFEALEREPDVSLRYIDVPAGGECRDAVTGRGLSGPGAHDAAVPALAADAPDAIILPGTKSTIADLQSLRARGFAGYLRRYVAAGGELVGFCGGFQMLGNRILDPGHTESLTGRCVGLRLLPAVTTFEPTKRLAQVRGIHVASGLPVSGYEIRLGRMQHDRPASEAVLQLDAPDLRHDGLSAHEGRVWGTHVHGLFDSAPLRRWWLNRLRARRGLPPAATRSEPARDRYDRLADAVRPHLDMDAIYGLLGLAPRPRPVPRAPEV